MMGMADGKAMLTGLKVVDLTTVVFGPYCTHILAELGADVIKVEVPGSGDSFRWSGKAAATHGMAPAFMAINGSKQSIALDLKTAADLETMKKLLSDADVFVLNVRGKAAERLGLDYEAVGTQPDILVPFEPEAIRSTGIDPAFDKALHLLASGRFAKMAIPLRDRKSSGRPSLCRL